MRLILVVEGQSEEAFGNHTLAPHLLNHDIYAVVTIVGTPTKRGSRPLQKGGGAFKYWERDIRRALGGPETNVRVTTLFDLYGLPPDFPDAHLHCAEPNTSRRCESLESALGGRINDGRFIPYIQRHEFEALVLASIDPLASLFDARDDLDGLASLKRSLDGAAPEDVNDSPDTAPSKRIKRLVPGFSKLIHGPKAIQLTGLATVRARCPRLDVWIKRLEALGGPPT